MGGRRFPAWSHGPDPSCDVDPQARGRIHRKGKWRRMRIGGWRIWEHGRIGDRKYAASCLARQGLLSFCSLGEMSPNFQMKNIMSFILPVTIETAHLPAWMKAVQHPPSNSQLDLSLAARASGATFCSTWLRADELNAFPLEVQPLTRPHPIHAQLQYCTCMEDKDPSYWFTR